MVAGLSTFSSREIATGIWMFLAILAIGLSRHSFRQSLINVLLAFCRTKILVLFLCMVCYVSGMIVILERIGVWNVSHLKDTVLWFLFTGVIVANTVITSAQADHIFSKIVRDSLKIVIVIQFLVNTYTFSLPIEIFIVPAIAFIAMLNAVAQSDPQYKSVAKFISLVQAAIGILILFAVIVKAASDYSSLFTVDALRNILLAPTLTILFLPFAYVLAVYSNYDQIIARLNNGAEKDPTLIKYAKGRIFDYARLKLCRVVKITTMASDLMKIRSKADVDQLIQSVRITKPSNKHIQHIH